MAVSQLFKFAAKDYLHDASIVIRSMYHSGDWAAQYSIPVDKALALPHLNTIAGFEPRRNAGTLFRQRPSQGVFR
jgi:hypothetical protein